MSVSRDEIKEALSQMPVLELVDLIKELEDEWGVSAAAPVGVAVAAAGDVPRLRNRLNLMSLCPASVITRSPLSRQYAQSPVWA